jgi:hypothetical protein
MSLVSPACGYARRDTSPGPAGERFHPSAKTFRGNLYAARRTGHNAGKTADILPGGLCADALPYLRASTNVDRAGDVVGAVCHRLTGTREFERSWGQNHGERLSRCHGRHQSWMAQVV